MERTRIKLLPTSVENTYTQEHSSSGAPSLASIMSNLVVEIKEASHDEAVIDLIGVEAPFANALRRVMLSEVPTMAIETVNLYQNTSPIPDEVLAHRFGLIPIAADPRLFDYKEGKNYIENKEYDEHNSILFKLNVKCYRDSEGNVQNSTVYSRDLEWVPMGKQAERFKIRPVYEDIIIAKLGPGQEIEAELYCEKGIGQTHAKWSPVCTASYKLMPDIRFTRKVTGQDAVEIKKVCPVGVFDIEDGQAVVAHPRRCTTCRECIRHKGQDVDLGKRKDHFICNIYLVTIESTGALSALDIFTEAIKEFQNKCRFWLEQLHS